MKKFKMSINSLYTLRFSLICFLSNSLLLYIFTLPKSHFEKATSVKQVYIQLTSYIHLSHCINLHPAPNHISSKTILTMPPNTAEQDAATELLIAQLIAADFDVPVLDPLPAFPILRAEDIFTEANHDNPSASPVASNEGLNRLSVASSSQTIAPISNGEGNSRLQQDEAVWWTPGRNGKGPTDEEGEGDERSSNENEGENGGEVGGEGSSKSEGKKEEQEEDEEDEGKDEDGFEILEFDDDDVEGGIIWVPSPGDQRVRRRRATRYRREVYDTSVAEIIVGDDETLEEILAAMIL